MNKVLIIGGGFAGLSALTKLCRVRDSLEVTLIDARTNHNFLPLLPDIIGRGLAPGLLLYNLKDLSRRLKFEFINEEVSLVDLQRKEVQTTQRTLSYDYLIIATGSQTNFYGQDHIAAYAYKIDNVEDVQRLLETLKDDRLDSFVVAGAGYTGIEVATNLRMYFNKARKNKSVVMVEPTNQILGPLPEWMRDYVGRNLHRLNIPVLLNSKIANIEQDKIALSTGEMFNKAVLIWTAGVKGCEFTAKLNVEKNRQSRIGVDDYLRVNNNCFVVADAAEFSYQGKSLRMAVQFSIAQGCLAGNNILRHIRGLALKKYKPLDLGYIIPMANNKSCGVILGLKVKGAPATFFHYAMCIYRSYSLKNRLGLIRQLWDTILPWPWPGQS